jgi:hypothetical protein
MSNPLATAPRPPVVGDQVMFDKTHEATVIKVHRPGDPGSFVDLGYQEKKTLLADHHHELRIGGLGLTR